MPAAPDHWPREDLDGVAAIVTAGGAGIGKAIALEWARRGGRVLVTDVDGDAAEKVAGSIREVGGEAVARPLDVNDPARVRSVLAALVVAYGPAPVLFNVAGVNLARRVDEMDDADWYRIIDTNLSSVYRCSKELIPHMRRLGGGAIVNVASTAGLLAENRCAAYTAAKGGVVLLTKNMAMDYARDGIRVNAVCPGSTMTPRIQEVMDADPRLAAKTLGLSAMKRFALPEEIARPAVFLASSDASYITGATLVVDGGLTAGVRFDIFEDG